MSVRIKPLPADPYQRCENCAFWSDLQARISPSGLRAKCLHPTSTVRGRWRLGNGWCKSHQFGDPIDLSIEIKQQKETVG